MISLKKAVFALGLGIGLAASMNAWAYPGCVPCKVYGERCLAGDNSYCRIFSGQGCMVFGLPGELTCDGE